MIPDTLSAFVAGVNLTCFLWMVSEEEKGWAAFFAVLTVINTLGAVL